MLLACSLLLARNLLLRTACRCLLAARCFLWPAAAVCLQLAAHRKRVCCKRAHRKRSPQTRAAAAFSLLPLLACRLLLQFACSLLPCSQPVAAWLASCCCFFAAWRCLLADSCCLAARSRLLAGCCGLPQPPSLRSRYCSPSACCCLLAACCLPACSLLPLLACCLLLLPDCSLLPSRSLLLLLLLLRLCAASFFVCFLLPCGLLLPACSLVLPYLQFVSAACSQHAAAAGLQPVAAFAACCC